MTSSISCPNCNQQASPSDQKCAHCGVDLALAAILVESSLSLDPQTSAGFSLSPEILVPRLGDYLVEKELLGREKLDKALNYQKEQIKEGKSLLLGQALIKLKLIDREMLDRAVTEQILELQEALRQSNKHLEQRVQERTSELQDALYKITELNQLKSNFVSNISHELRTPLAHMIGYLDLLTTEALGSLSHQQKDALNILNSSYSRLQELIDNLLTFSLASQGRMDLQLIPISLENLTKVIVSQSQTKALEAKVDIVTNLPKDLPKIQADQNKITWVLLQLVENAIKFNQPGGKVNISAIPDSLKVAITITDTGIGIQEAKLDEIFESFHQLDGSPSRKYGGTGLGLALAQRIIDAHGSSIDVTSKVGEGTRFTFSLPVDEVQK
ncbi:MAG: hypothetical protein FVQ83_09060 [Chloroflexi bacterium]|nr:hypothetical protein [Chloroflexota bacterium]